MRSPALILAGIIVFATVSARSKAPPILSVGTAIALASNVFEGTWREDQVVVSRRDGRVVTVRPEASLYVVSSTHYAMMATFGVPPRPLFQDFTPTDAERIVAFNTFWGHTGRYDVEGNTITLHPTVAKSPNLMAGGRMTLGARASGDTLWLTGDFNNYVFRVRGHLVPDTFEPWSREVIRLVRIR